MARRLVAPPPEPSEPKSGSPTFTIVIPAYQVAPYIAETVRSALEQTVAPHEVVVVDDGSTDGIDAALAPYIGRITLVRQPNRGPGAAKLAGARAATGDFVSLLDGDDYYLPERLEALTEAVCARPDLDIFVTNAYMELDGCRLRTVYDETWSFASDDQRGEILRRCFLLGHSAVRRSLLMSIEEIDRHLIDDWFCWATLILRGARAGLVDQPLSCYRVRPGSLSTGQLALLRAGIETLDALEQQPSARPDDRTVLAETRERWRLDLALEEAREALRCGDGEARRLLAGIARDSGQGWRQRSKAVVGLVAPGRARRRIAEQDRRGWVGAGGVRVPHAPD